jgi:hypothetical protein
MTIRSVQPEEWYAFCMRTSRSLLGKRAAIEIASLSSGHCVEDFALPLLGISFRPVEDLISIHFDGVDHVVRRPRALYVDERPEGPVSLEIIDAEGYRRIVVVRDPPMLTGVV